jgi:hypothetical protein
MRACRIEGNQPVTGYSIEVKASTPGTTPAPCAPCKRWLAAHVVEGHAYLAWYRDGRAGYLNADGSASITGRPWPQPQA